MGWGNTNGKGLMNVRIETPCGIGEHFPCSLRVRNEEKALTVLPSCHMGSASFTAMYNVPENDTNQRAEKRNKGSEMESDKREGEVRMGVLSMFYIACDCRECGKQISPGLFKDNRTIFNLPRFLFTHTFSLTPTLFSFSLIDQSVLLLLSRLSCSLSHEAF